MVPISMPPISIARPLSGLPPDTVDAAIRASRMAAKYSAAPNERATRTIAGAMSIKARIPSDPPQNELNAAVNNAVPAFPCLAKGWPSRTVMALPGVPGMLRRIDVIEPPYSAP